MHSLYSASCLSRATALAAILVAAAFPTARANPQDGVVSDGQATLTQTGNKLDIVQQTNSLVIDWRTFDIAPNEFTEFHQPSASAIALNRVGGNAPSQIFGKLIANGNIVIVNSNGILFGRGSEVNINSLIATTADISNQNFSEGKLIFDRKGNASASIINNGIITAKESGLVGLVAPNVENNGIITANLGRVHLASGDTATVDLYGDGLMEVAVSDDVISQTVTNTGTINAAGGKIALTAAAGKNIVNSLITVKGELHAPTVSTHRGHIYIYAEGSNAVAGNVEANKGKKAGSSKVVVDAVLDVSGKRTGEAGGTLDILADTTRILSGTRIDASGDAGGGYVRIGGDFHGAGQAATALSTVVEDGAFIDARSLSTGDGGHVVVWADQETAFEGQININADGESGNGGFAETSGSHYLYVGRNAFVNAGSRRGRRGTWLLDPYDITIQTAAGTTAATGNPNFAANGAASYVLVSTIEAALNSNTNVTITTDFAHGGATGNGDITVANAIGAAGAVTGTGSLTLSAYRNINVNAAITTNGGAIILQANNANTGGSISVTANLTSNGGDIVLGGGADAYTGNAKGTAAQVQGIYLYGPTTLSSGAGNIILNGAGYDSGANNYGIHFSTPNTAGSKVTFQTTSGNITLKGTGGAGTDSNSGIYFAYPQANGSYEILSTSGNISLQGYGKGSGLANDGMFLYKTTITTGSTGTIALSGTGSTTSTSTFNRGVVWDYSNALTTVSGNINITGVGGTGVGGSTNAAYGNSGVLFWNTGGTRSITSTSGNIIINGAANAATTGYYNAGVNMQSGLTLTTGGTGGISITGVGYGNQTDSYGVANSANMSTANGNIEITGTGGGLGTAVGVFLQGASTFTASGSGNIILIGTGGPAATGTFNHGIYSNGVAFSMITNTGNISLNGTGGTGVGATTNIWYGNNGINLTGAGAKTFTTTSGNISMIGRTKSTVTGDYNRGITIENGAVTAGGTGTVTISGTSSSAAGNNNYGIHFQTTNVTASSDVNMTGVAGGATIGLGVYLNGGTISSTGAGNVAIYGTGSSVGTGDWNAGIFNNGVAIKIQANTGNVTLDGTGGKGAGTSSSAYLGNNGVVMAGVGTKTIASTAGSVSITGRTHALATGDNNRGVAITTGAISAGGTGSVTINGTSNSTTASTFNHGVYISSSTVTTFNGNIGMTGVGSGQLNGDGVQLSGDTVQVTGTGRIDLAGTGSTAGTTSQNRGFVVDNALTMSTVSGAINITGTGGTGTAANSSGSGNCGILFWNSSGTRSITSTSGSITLTGNTHASALGYYNTGVWVNNGLTITTGGTGSISVLGTSNSTGATGSNHGTFVVGLTINSVNGDVTLTGTGNVGGFGIYYDTSSIVSTGSSKITVTSVAGTGSSGFRAVNTTSIGGVSATGNINLNQDTATWGSLTLKTTGTVTFAPTTAGTTIKLNGGASGTLDVSSTILAAITSASKVVVGNTSAGLITAAASYNPGRALQLISGAGGITLPSTALTMGSNALTLQTDGTISNINKISGTSTLSFLRSNAAGAMTLGGAGISISSIATGFSSLIFGSTTDTGDTTVNTATWLSPVSIYARNITYAGAQTLGVNSLLNLANANTTINNGVSITSTASSGNSIVLSSGGNFVNSSGSATPINPGSGTARYIIYSSSNSSDTMGSMSVPTNKSYNKTYNTLAPASVSGTDNAWVYSSVLGTITVFAVAQNVSYGTAPTTSLSLGTTYNLSCVGNCGSYALASGPSSLSISGAAGTSSSGNYNVGAWTITLAHDAVLDAASIAAGYVLDYATGVLTVGQKALTASLTGSVSKEYDRTDAATLGGGNYTLTGVIAGDTVTLNNPVSGTYDTVNVGSSKTVTVTGLALGGISQGNYTVNASANAAVGSITAKALTVTAANANKTAGNTDPVFSYFYSGLVSGDGVAYFTGALARQAGEDAGVYTIGRHTLSAIGNYSIGTFNVGVFTIDPGASTSANIPNTVVRKPSYRLYEEEPSPKTAEQMTASHATVETSSMWHNNLADLSLNVVQDSNKIFLCEKSTNCAVMNHHDL